MLKRGDIVRLTPSPRYVDYWLSGMALVRPGELGYVLEVDAFDAWAKPRDRVRAKVKWLGYDDMLMLPWWAVEDLEKVGEVKDAAEL